MKNAKQTGKNARITYMNISLTKDKNVMGVVKKLLLNDLIQKIKPSKAEFVLEGLHSIIDGG